MCFRRLSAYSGQQRGFWHLFCFLRTVWRAAGFKPRAFTVSSYHTKTCWAARTESRSSPEPVLRHWSAELQISLQQQDFICTWAHVADRHHRVHFPRAEAHKPGCQGPGTQLCGERWRNTTESRETDDSMCTEHTLLLLGLVDLGWSHSCLPDQLVPVLQQQCASKGQKK